MRALLASGVAVLAIAVVSGPMGGYPFFTDRIEDPMRPPIARSHERLFSDPRREMGQLPSRNVAAGGGK